MKNSNLNLHEIITKNIKIFNILISHTWDDEDELVSIEIYELEDNTYKSLHRLLAEKAVHIQFKYNCDFNVDEALEVLELINRRSEAFFKYPVNHLALRRLTIHSLNTLDLNELGNILENYNDINN